MSLRLKILVFGVGTTLIALVILAVLLIKAHLETYLGEAELRAKTFLSVLSVQTASHLASNRIEEMDSILASLMERDLELLDIRFVAVLDSQRRVVAHTEPSMYGRTLDDVFSVEASASAVPITRRIEEGDRNILLCSMPVTTNVPGLEGIRWGTTIAGIGLARVYQNISSLVLKAALTTVLAALAAALVSFFILSGTVVRPLRRLTLAARRYAEGDLAGRAEIGGSWELAELARTFNEMAASIQANTERLEHEVKARTLELEEAVSKLRQMANTDALTGLYNHRFFEQTIDMEVRRCKRAGNKLSLLMIDVDHFKNFNDENGHQAGDMVLREVARIIDERIRATDVACRYGGEEFTVILPATGTVDAVRLAEELRNLIQEHPFPGEEHQPGGRLTISIGVATYPDHAGDKDELVRAADEAMYKAKQGGRNRVETAV